MAIILQREVITPNAVFVPQIILSTSVRDGVLETSANIGFQAAVVDADGRWAPATQVGNLYIQDLLNLEPDLSKLQDRVNQLYLDIIGIVSDINTIRKVI